MTDDSDFPRLTPPDDRFPGSDRLHRKPEELTDEQFDLLAAAWAEGALAAGSLADMEAAIEALPSRQMRAESFRSIRLTPYNDKWIYRDRLLRQSPATAAIRRSLVLTLLAAAAVVAFIIMWPSAARQATDTLPGSIHESTVMSDALIPEGSPIIIQGSVEEPAARVTADINSVTPRSVRNSDAMVSTRTADATMSIQVSETTGSVKTVPAFESTEAAKQLPVSVSHAAETSFMIAAADGKDLRPVEIKTATVADSRDLRPVEIRKTTAAPDQTTVSAEMTSAGKEPSWVFRGISALAKAITKEEKNIDGYAVASACVNGISNFLGWEMELQQASNKEGQPVAVNFNSSLISVSAPVNKNSP